MFKQKIKEIIRKVCTVYDRKGETCYLLEEDHFAQIYSLIDELVDKQKEDFEIQLTKVIDDLYLEYKKDFCDYKNKTHKLGWFKEQIKFRINKKLKE